MTTMMTSSQFGLEDMEALLWGPSSPMADNMGSLFYNPDQEHQEGEGASAEGGGSPASPLTSSSLSSSSSPPPFYSPPPSPPAVSFHEDKAGDGSDLPPLHWLGHPDQLRSDHSVSDDRNEDAFGDFDWMTEKMDLNEFDLESLIGSCSPTEEPSTEDLVASLNCPMELDLPVPTLSSPELPCHPSAPPPSTSPTTDCTVCENASVISIADSESLVDELHSPSSPLSVPEPEQELEIKSEPASPDPTALVIDSSSSPVYTLDLGSEVDVSASEYWLPEMKWDSPLQPAPQPLLLQHQRSSRTRPYPDPYKDSPSSPCDSDDDDDDITSPQGSGWDEKVSLKAPRDKKSKKMEQNKTAATRYRQKKRAEQEALLTEHTILERKNVELKEKAESMAREIEYLKELMEEVRLARVKKGLSPDL
uniref:Cyclic AMP-dependent transcription factor ATF-4 n=1 Tax=Cynoglossus semilaevis TaxID=244447 RepID=A0A3P8VBD7_CYNSE